MHVVQPYPTTLNPRRSRNGCRPLRVRYSLTTRDPGASEVFTHGWVVSPSSTAFLASNPAASITLGFEVLVQEVMAAITTSPCASAPIDFAGSASLSVRLGVGRLSIISITVRMSTSRGLPAGVASPDCLPPPGSG